MYNRNKKFKCRPPRLALRLISGVALFCGFVGAGCTSVESTMVTRNETNQTWERHNCLNGIPITLKVPTHLKVYVFHKHYLEFVSAGGQIIDVVPLNLDIVVRDVAHELMYTDKIFVVDFKRPVAGSSNLKVNMTDQQYIDSIQHDITDNTISTVGTLIGKLVGGGLKLNATPASAASDNTFEIKSLVAVGIFEIESPDFEQQVRQFINCHVNKAHDAWVAPCDVTGFNRVEIRGNKDLQHPPLCPSNGELSVLNQPWPPDQQTSIFSPAPVGPENPYQAIQLPRLSAPNYQTSPPTVPHSLH